MNSKKLSAIAHAIGAALFYAINVPCSKLLLNGVSPTMMAALLYLGAGIGVGTMYLFHGTFGRTETAHCYCFGYRFKQAGYHL